MGKHKGYNEDLRSSVVTGDAEVIGQILISLFEHNN